MRVLILSAPVGAGHDAAARGVAAELRARGDDVEIDDGLALIGRGVHKLVVDGYHCQIEYAPWSWRVLYRATRSRRLIRLFGVALAVRGGGRLLDRIEGGGYDRIVSAYPVVSMVLARLRRTGRLRGVGHDGGGEVHVGIQIRGHHSHQFDAIAAHQFAQRLQRDFRVAILYRARTAAGRGFDPGEFRPRQNLGDHDAS